MIFSSIVQPPPHYQTHQPVISSNQGSHTADAFLGRSNEVISSRHQQSCHLSSQHHPSPYHITTTLPPSNPTRPVLRNPIQSIELGSSLNNAHEFRNSLYDIQHHRASDAFQGPIYSAHKPAISPEQTNHVSHTIQEAHQMTCIITPLHLLPFHYTGGF